MINQATVSSAVVPVTLADLMAKADVSQSDVASLHRHLFSDASLDRVQADALFDLERATLTRCDAWTTFFVEAITDHVVWGVRPTGRLDETQAVWLLDQVDRGRTAAGLALLVNVLDEAQQFPLWFAAAVKARAAAGWPGVFRGEDEFSRAVPQAA